MHNDTVYEKDYQKQGPVKLCSHCARFMPVGSDNLLLPHKELLSGKECPGAGE